MRLFKRPSTSPRLVSASAVTQQDETNSHVSTREIKDLSAEEICCSSRSAKKGGAGGGGISTWGRRVGERCWDRLKRSDSSEVLSVPPPPSPPPLSSGQRSPWGLEKGESLGCRRRRHCEDLPDDIPDKSIEKPKRVSRVESLRNLFRGSERGSDANRAGETWKRDSMIEEDVEDEDVEDCRRNGAAATTTTATALDFSRYGMEKSLSEGALKKVARLSKEFRNEALVDRRNRLSRSIRDLQEQQRIFDYILNNRDIIKTEEGATLVRETLDKTNRPTDGGTPPASRDSVLETLTKKAAKRGSVDLVKKKEERLNQGRRSFIGSPLEELMCTLRLGCDESGYDSDSTRAGADSPDSAADLLHAAARSNFSITSDDYHGVDLSLSMSTPIKEKATVTRADSDRQNNRVENEEEKEELDEISFNESMRTDTTTLVSEDEDDAATAAAAAAAAAAYADTDSCDESLVFPELQMKSSIDRLAVKKMEALRDKERARDDEAFDSGRNSVKNKDAETMQESRVKKWKKLPKSAITRAVRMRVGGGSGRGGDSLTNASALNLLENAASPCKDSPPATRLPLEESYHDHVRYYSPKRCLSEPEEGTKPAKRTNNLHNSGDDGGGSSKARRELKTVKLTVEEPASLGIRVEKREAVRPFYVVAKLEENGEAAKSKRIRLGDEVVRVCGRRLRGMSAIEAKNALRNSIGTVELRIARDAAPSFETRTKSGGTVAGDYQIGDSRTDSELLRDVTAIAAPLATLGKSASTNEINVRKENDEIVPSAATAFLTGMRKFQVTRKRNSVPSGGGGGGGGGGDGSRGISTCLAETTTTTTTTSDYPLTIVLEKGAAKKLGFSIVGGSDSNRGNMGIFVKDVLNGGQAAEAGALRPNDEIIAVNGQLVQGVTHAKALQFFKLAKPGALVLHVARRDSMRDKRFFEKP